MKKIILLSLMITMGFEGFAQSVELRPSQGISVPQFTTAFIDALTNQPKGTVVFDKDLNVMKYWNGTAWISLTTGGGGSGVGWVENGINLENTNTGNVGIGLTSPTAKLAINGTDTEGSLTIKGSQYTSHFNRPENIFQENTYIRGGTPSSNVLIGDIGQYVGVGLSSPDFSFDVSGEAQFRSGIRAKGSVTKFYDNGFSGPTFYDGGLTLINTDLNLNQRMKLDGSNIQTYARNTGPNNIDAVSSMVLNPFGGNVGIGTNFTPQYKLHLYSTGEELVKIDGTNSLVIFHDRTSNAQYGFFRAWTKNPFNPASLYGFEIGTPPILGGDPAKHLMFSTNYALRMVIRDNGNVGIGTTDPGTYKLAVNGSIKAREIRVSNQNWADYVFDEKYALRPLLEVENYIHKHKHLPEIPAATVIEKEGIDMSEMQSKMMAKIEELTLYIIEQNKRIEKLEKGNSKAIKSK